LANANTVKRHGKGALGRWSEYPVEGQKPKQLGFGCFPTPPAIGIGAGNFLIAKHLHHLVFGNRRAGALLLEVDSVVPLGAFEHNSIG